MSQKATRLVIDENILKDEKFLAFKRSFTMEHQNVSVECNTDGVTLKGPKRYINIFKDFVNNFYLDPSKFNIKLRNGNKFEPMNKEQRDMIGVINDNDISFITGSAGTGKSLVATVIAAYLLKIRKIDKIILTRPAVEAGGEKIGFLPGDIKEKLLPYLMPLYDYLELMFTKEEITTLEADGKIEIIPLAFMRGRSLPNSVIIVDEAQNTTYDQIKMIITRIGINTKLIFTGDIYQNDMKFESGLSISKRLFDGVDGIGTLEFSDENIVRHPIIKKILERCDDYESELDG